MAPDDHPPQEHSPEDQTPEPSDEPEDFTEEGAAKEPEGAARGSAEDGAGAGNDDATAKLAPDPRLLAALALASWGAYAYRQRLVGWWEGAGTIKWGVSLALVLLTLWTYWRSKGPWTRTGNVVRSLRDEAPKWQPDPLLTTLTAIVAATAYLLRSGLAAWWAQVPAEGRFLGFSAGVIALAWVYWSTRRPWHEWSPATWRTPWDELGRNLQSAYARLEFSSPWYPFAALVALLGAYSYRDELPPTLREAGLLRWIVWVGAASVAVAALRWSTNRIVRLVSGWWSRPHRWTISTPTFLQLGVIIASLAAWRLDEIDAAQAIGVAVSGSLVILFLTRFLRALDHADDVAFESHWGGIGGGVGGWRLAPPVVYLVFLGFFGLLLTATALGPRVTEAMLESAQDEPDKDASEPADSTDDDDDAAGSPPDTSSTAGAS